MPTKKKPAGKKKKSKKGNFNNKLNVILDLDAMFIASNNKSFSNNIVPFPSTTLKNIKGDSDVTDGMGIALPEDKIKYLESQTQALEIQLAHRSEMTADASFQYESMKKSLDETMKLYEEEKKATTDIMRDMTRQYKGMEDDLLNKINERERTIQELRDELNLQRKESKKSLQDKDEVILQREKEIQNLDNEKEELCSQFARMLSNAFDQMKERIEVHSACYNEQAVPIQHRMEKFNFKVKPSS